jgi:hypothetical protein
MTAPTHRHSEDVMTAAIWAGIAGGTLIAVILTMFGVNL